MERRYAADPGDDARGLIDARRGGVEISAADLDRRQNAEREDVRCVLAMVVEVRASRVVCRLEIAALEMQQRRHGLSVRLRELVVVAPLDRRDARDRRVRIVEASFVEATFGVDAEVGRRHPQLSHAKVLLEQSVVDLCGAVPGAGEDVVDVLHRANAHDLARVAALDRSRGFREQPPPDRERDPTVEEDPGEPRVEAAGPLQRRRIDRAESPQALQGVGEEPGGVGRDLGFVPARHQIEHLAIARRRGATPSAPRCEETRGHDHAAREEPPWAPRGLLAQTREGARVRLGRFQHAPAVGQREADAPEELGLALGIARVADAEEMEPRRLAEVVERHVRCGAARRLVAGGHQVLLGLERPVGAAEVVGEHAEAIGAALARQRRQHVGDARMEMGAPLARDAVVDGFVGERVRECGAGVGPDEQSGSDQHGEVGVERLRIVDDRREDRTLDGRARHGGRFEHGPFRRGERVHAREQELLHRLRNGRLGDVRIARRSEPSHDLLDEEGIPAGSRGDARRVRRRHRVAGERSHEPHRFVGIERRQGDPLERLRKPVDVRGLGPTRHDEEERRGLRRLAGDRGQQVERRRVGPVEILEHDDDRPRGREALEESPARVRDHRGERRSLDRRGVGLDAEESREHRRQRLVLGRRERPERRAELCASLGGTRAAVDPDPGAQHVGERPEAPPLADHRAPSGEHAVPVLPALGHELADEARLADAGGADDVDPAAAASSQRRDVCAQHGELARAADELGVIARALGEMAELPCDERIAVALAQRHRRGGCELGGLRLHARTEQHGAGTGCCGEPPRDPDRLPRERRPRIGVSVDDENPRLDADTYRRDRLHRARRRERASRRLLDRRRRTERGDEARADALDHVAVVRRDTRRDRIAGRHHLRRVLLERRVAARGIAELDDDDGPVTARGGRRWGGGRWGGWGRRRPNDVQVADVGHRYGLPVRPNRGRVTVRV